MNINETATTTVYLDGQQAESQLKELQRELDKVRDKMQKAFAANDLKEMKKLETQQKSLTREMQSFRKATFDADRVLKNLSGSTLNDLYKTKRKLSGEIRNLTRDTKQYANTSKDLRRVEQEIKKVQTQMGRARTVSLSLKSAFSMLAPAALFTAAIAGIGRLVKSLPEAAMQMEGESRRSAIVFGDSLSYVEGESEKLAKQMGLTNREFVAAAAATGDLLIPMNFTREQSAKMSVELQSLAGALDEWTGGTLGAKEVSTILTKAVLGETEQIKQLGIVIDQSSTEYNKRIKLAMETTGATKEQARAMDILEQIQSKSADAQTAYTQEGNKLLRTKKELVATINNLKEGFINLFKVPVAKQLEEQRVQTNLLAAQLLNTNIPLEKRNELYDQLKRIHPDIVAGIDKEKINTGLLLKNLADYNKEMAKKIALAGLEEDQQKILAKQQSKMAKLMLSQTDAIKKINDTEIYFQKKGVSEGVLNSLDELRKMVNSVTDQEIDNTKLNELFASIIEGADIAGEQFKINFLGSLSQVSNFGKAYRDDIEKNKDALAELSETQRLLSEGIGSDGSGSGDSGGFDGGTKTNLLKELEDYHKQRILIITTQMAEEKMSKKVFDQEMFLEELTYLQAKKELLEQAGEDTYNIELEIQQKLANASEKISEWRAEQHEEYIKHIDSQMDELGDILDEEIAAQIKAEEEKATKIKAIEKVTTRDTKKEIEERAKAINDTAARMGDTLGQMAADGKLTAEDFAKGMLIIGLKSLRNVVNMALVEITAKQIASKGFVGIVTSTILSTVVNTAFAAMEAKMQMNSGRYPVRGPDDGKTYSAQYVGVPKTGIYSGPTVGLFSENMPEMVIDGPTTRNLQVNYPGIIDSIMAARQFDTGRYPAGGSSVSTTAADPNTAALAATMNRLSAALERGIEAKFSYKTVRDIRDRTIDIENIESAAGG